MTNGIFKSGIHMKLIVLCFLFAGAALAEEITPTFSAVPNDRFAKGAMQYQVTWEIEEQPLSFIANCRVSSGGYSLSANDIVLSEDGQWDQYRAVCDLRLSTPLLLNFNVMLFGSELPSWKNSDAYSETMKKIHYELLNGRSLVLEKNPNRFQGLLGDPRTTGTHKGEIILKASEEYINSINEFIGRVSKKDAEAAVKAEEQRRQWALRDQQRSERERNWRIVLTILAGVAIILLYAIYRSGVIQRGAKTAAYKVSSVVESGKRKIREKKRLRSAKELVVWSELREKGHITEEEFEKKKRELME